MKKRYLKKLQNSWVICAPALASLYLGCAGPGAKVVPEVVEAPSDDAMQFTRDCLDAGGAPMFGYGAEVDGSFDGSIEGNTSGGKASIGSTYHGEGDLWATCLMPEIVMTGLPLIDIDSCSTPEWWQEDKDGDGALTLDGIQIEACNIYTPPGAAPWLVVTGDMPFDCDDTNANIRATVPGKLDVVEICDFIDNDCDGLIDAEDDDVDLRTGILWLADCDDDGYPAAPSSTWGQCFESAPDLVCPLIEFHTGLLKDIDCDDTKAAIGPPDAIYGCSVY